MTKRPMFSLGSRLLSCAQKVRRGCKIVDVGTDHAYLPIWLVKNGLVSEAIASDINEGPLESARENIIKYRVQEKVTTILSDGLEKISPSKVDDIVIAGMGGDLIARIISKTTWIKDHQKRLILQPMSCEDRLRKELVSNGFLTLEETVTKSSGRIYVVMVCSYVGNISENNVLFPYVGKLLESPTDVTYEYISRVLRHLRNKNQSPDSNVSDIILKLEDVLSNGKS